MIINCICLSLIVTLFLKLHIDDIKKFKLDIVYCRTFFDKLSKDLFIFAKLKIFNLAGL